MGLLDTASDLEFEKRVEKALKKLLPKEMTGIKVLAHIVKGLKGEPGKDSTIAGPQGERGAQGPKGDRGADGINGRDSTIAGPKGDRGSDGRNGKDGKTGKQGKNGLNGIDGKDGKDGRDGSPDSGKQIIQKINALPPSLENQIDARHIKNLPQGKKAMSRGGGGDIVLTYSLDSVLDGSTKTFTIPFNTKIITVLGTSSPFRFLATTDFTRTSTTITFTSAVDETISLAAGQGVSILYV